MSTPLTLTQLQSVLSAADGWECISAEVLSTCFGRRYGYNLGIDAMWRRVVGGRILCCARTRWMTYRYSYGLDRMIDCDEARVEWLPVFGSAITSADTVYPLASEL